MASRLVVVLWRFMVAACLGLVLLLVSPAALLVPAARAAQPVVVVMPTTGIVDQVMDGYIHDGIQQAANQGAAAVVLEIDTPGGSLDSTHDIVQTLLSAPVPVITWVAPAGSRAASAGTFITLAGNIALMAPGTNIGAASPVGSQGQDITGTEGQKVLNDAIANITSIAELRGRNVDWAVSTVKDAKSYTAAQAVSAGAVDGTAATLDDVLAFANGRTVQIAGRALTLDLAGATTQEVGMNPWQGFIHLLADPNIAFVLFTLGFYGVLFELMNPNFFTGTLGGIAIVLGLVGLGSLPLNVGGLLLVLLSILLFVIDLTVTSHGLLTAGGIVCFLLGSATLYTQPGPTTPNVGVAWPIVAIIGGSTAAFMSVVVTAAIRSRRMQPAAIGTGGGSLAALPVGSTAEVRRALAPVGSVYAAGEEWSARAGSGDRIERGSAVRVLGQEGLTVIVERTGPLGSGASQEVPAS